MTTDKVKNALETLEKGILDLTSSEMWKRYLQTLSLFHNYSFGNHVLILAQMQHATQVAGFNTWKKFGRSVKKGEKGIQILAPMKVKVEKEQTEALVGEQERDLNEAEKKSKTVSTSYIRFRVVYVFDISQTTGEPLPEVAHVLEGDCALYEKLKERCLFPIIEQEDCGGANGYYHLTDRTITILSTNSELQKAKTLIHEWAHGILHQETRLDRSSMEVEAESVAYSVCHALGLDTSSYSFGYVASWAGGSQGAVEKIKLYGERIQWATHEILRVLMDDSKQEVA